VATDYDELPYPVFTHEHTHPDRLATIARLHAVPAPSIETARILDLGCAAGGNLATIAITLPKAKLVGIDLSERQILAGREQLLAAGIENVDLRVGDLTKQDASLGTFDYVIAHGLLSWVSADAMDDVLRLVARVLAPGGVAYFGYNTYPGARVPGAVRDMLQFDLRGEKGTATDRVARAREMLAWIAKAPPPGPFGQAIVDEIEWLGRTNDTILIHDDLAPHNRPLHFHKLAARARRLGLAYLCEAVPARSADHGADAAAVRARERAPDELVFAEQYYDFLVNRRFRRTLFCRREHQPARTIDPKVIDSLFVSSRTLLREREPDLAPGVRLTFEAPRSEMTSDHPLTKAAMMHLSSICPRAIPFAELLEVARARVRESDDSAVQILRENLVSAFLSATDVVELRVFAPPARADVSERPIASALARERAQTTYQVPNLRHEIVELDAVLARILRMLDGTRDRAALLADIGAAVVRGEITLPGRLHPADVENALSALARSALLVG
jgi:SAM-dependent methyltransferase